MITGRDFFVFSDDWGRHPSSCQHLFRRIAPINRVFWVHTIGTRLPTLSRADVARAWGKFRAWTRPLPERGEADDASPVRVLEPFMTPFDRWPAGRSVNAAFLSRALRRATRENDVRRPFLVTTIPNAASLVGKAGESIAVYYCVDDFSEWPGADRVSMLAMEEELLGKVDLVLATSEMLFEDKSARHPRVRLLRHGVDWDAFHDMRGTAPAALLERPRPRVGATGLVDARLDTALVEALARALPEVSFVFVGPRQLPTGPLDALANVTFLPAVPYADVPAVLGALDVAILPYVETRLTERINPLKLREFLASGTPIVATPLPEAARYADVMETARGVDEWIPALRRAIAEGRTHAEKRARRVREESWEARAEEFSRHLLETESLVRPAVETA